MNAFGAFLFDLDGTLLDTHSIIQAGLVNFALKNGVSPEQAPFFGTDEFYLTTLGVPLRSVLAKVLKIDPSDSSLENHCSQYRAWQSAAYSSADPSALVFPTVREGLLALKASGKRLAVVSTRAINSVEHLLKITGLRDLFEVVVGLESTARTKPQPDPLLYAMKLLNVSPSQCIMIGDTEHDLFAAQAASTAAALVNWSKERDKVIATVSPHISHLHVITSFTQLL
ncbi:pyrophosphatase PpaX [Pelomyxa schiedti]|nr:pyrophosphatase PpaX [Pelomyxa schiedti]